MKTNDLRSRTRSPQNYFIGESTESKLPIMFENQKWKQVVKQLNQYSYNIIESS